jgi:hypothetical protein
MTQKLSEKEVQRLMDKGVECLDCEFFATCEGATTQNDCEPYLICEDFKLFKKKEQVTFT